MSDLWRMKQEGKHICHDLFDPDLLRLCAAESQNTPRYFQSDLITSYLYISLSECPVCRSRATAPAKDLPRLIEVGLMRVTMQ
jgi:hypothetical protein